MHKIQSTEKDITNMVHNALDLCGSWTDQVKDYCIDEMLDFNSKIVQNICFKAVTSYNKCKIL